MNEQAIKLYEQAQANYPKLKTQIEAQVVRWFWAAGGVGLFSLEPFYFEEHNFAKSKILKETPEDSDNKYQYGVNEKDEIIVGRSYTEFKGQCYETFYFGTRHAGLCAESHGRQRHELYPRQCLHR